MKAPHEYLPPPRHTDAGPVVALADAERAVAQALADAEKYRHLLLAALRRTPSPAHETSSTSPAR